MTSGKPKEESRYGSPASLASKLRSGLGVRLFVVGLRPADPARDLGRIVGLDHVGDVFLLQNKGDIDEIAEKIANKLC